MGANAQTAVPAFTAGQVLTAAQQTQINTGIPVFADTTARDAAFGGTGEKVLAEGQMAYIENIAGSSAVQYYDGAAWATLVTGGLTLIKTQTVGTAVSSVTVSDVFSSTYDNYLVQIANIDASASGVSNFLTFGATTTGYYGSMYIDRATTGTSTTSRTSNGSACEIGVMDANDDSFTTVTILSPNLAKRTALSGLSNAGQFSTWFAGNLANTTQYTAFTLTPSAGTITGGTIRVYGYQNS